MFWFECGIDDTACAVCKEYRVLHYSLFRMIIFRNDEQRKSFVSFSVCFQSMNWKWERSYKDNSDNHAQARSNMFLNILNVMDIPKIISDLFIIMFVNPHWGDQMQWKRLISDQSDNVHIKKSKSNNLLGFEVRT